MCVPFCDCSRGYWPHKLDLTVGQPKEPVYETFRPDCSAFGPNNCPSRRGGATMTGNEITVALTDKKLAYKDASQDFRASGKTRYTQGGRESWGVWRVDNNQYCANGHLKGFGCVITWTALAISFALLGRVMTSPLGLTPIK